MAVKDRSIQYVGLRTGLVPVPNTVSRSVGAGDRSFATVVYQSGKPVLDSELELNQDSSDWGAYLLQRWQTPSGWLRGGGTHSDAYDDYVLGDIGALGLSDDSPGAVALDGTTLVNAIVLPRIEAVVGGWSVVLEYTNTSTLGYNIITLQAPTVYDGILPPTRCDFVFVEVWPALVAPSPAAKGWVRVADNGALVGDVDNITIDVNVLLAVAGAPGVDQFQIGADATATAVNIAAAINDPANSFAVLVSARAYADTVYLTSVVPGVGILGPPPTGNFIGLLSSVPLVLVLSGAFLAGGLDRNNKPAAGQGQLYRHGNLHSPLATWLDDEMVDPVVDAETAQRIQIQYRIRATGETEAVSYKVHPDGFSTFVAGPPPNSAIFAQGPRTTPASGWDTVGRYYPFVPADRTSTWGNSSAVAYDVEDNGLWIAGDGTAQAAQDLGSADGFVYAIPITFVHRHNDGSTAAPPLQGWDPIGNSNGAPLHTHLGYNGFVGVVAAGASDRPDGHFSDVVVADNMLDLRRHVVLTGIDYSSELNYQMGSLLDGNNRTWSVDTMSKYAVMGTTGDVSTRFMVCNEIGRAAGPHGGPGSTAGRFIREFDHVARRFGSQPVVERAVFAFFPGDRAAGAVLPGQTNAGKYVVKAGGGPAAATWYEGDVLHLDLANFNITGLGGVFDGRLDETGSLAGAFFTAYAPTGTIISDVLSVYHDDGDYNAVVNQAAALSGIAGLGTTHVAITLDANNTQVSGGLNVATNDMVGDAVVGAVGSPRRIFVEVEITYPLGVGTSDTPDFLVTPDATGPYDGTSVPPGPITDEGAGPGPQVEIDMDFRPYDRQLGLSPQFRTSYREIQIEYVPNATNVYPPGPVDPNPVTDSAPAFGIVSRDPLNLYFPRRVYATGVVPYVVTVTDKETLLVRTVDNAATEYGSSSRKVVLDVGTPLSGAGHTLCDVTYYPVDPIPNYGVAGNGYQLAIYYRASSPQTAGVKEGVLDTTAGGVIPTTFMVEPLHMGGYTWTGQIGTGSLDRAYPYSTPLGPIPINEGTPPPAYSRYDWFFCATASVAIDDFNATTGLLALHPFVPPDTQGPFTFGGAAAAEKPTLDLEFRAFYPFADDTAYRPTIMSQPLFGATRHKVFYPFLARVSASVPSIPNKGLLFRKDEVVLIVLSRFAELDDDNSVRFTDTANRTLAAVYRTRNLMMVVGAK